MAGMRRLHERTDKLFEEGPGFAWALGLANCVALVLLAAGAKKPIRWAQVNMYSVLRL
jgi:hypothetical protein